MEKILQVKDLNISFHTFSGEVKAIRGVSFDLFKGETLAIVGESGSGKSVTTKSIMRLLPEHNSEIKGGEILFNGKDLTKLKDKEMQKIRGHDISMIFQDPMTSLNPTMKIGNQIMEPLIKHQNMSRHAAKERTLDLLKLVGIPKPEIRINQYPHQFSGGMRQRVVIAIALACNPQILIADEPTTALDVTIQAQILELMKDLQKKIDTSIIFITHDLGVVANVADRVAVMYGGKIVEIGTADEIFYNPQHPYTWGLISSMPDMDTDDEELFSIPGTPPDLLDPPKGDAFAPRNPFVMKIDLELEPPFFKVSDTHYAATWLLHPDAPKVEPPDAVKRRQNQFNGQTGVSVGTASLEKGSQSQFPGIKEGK
ncbi:ABC transporter ATP-binding protein [Neobacillus sp.]|uniref:ABC transporter ATP-binding protein n=1 Tax=Neobacillus sp. TaxID=2675273 RepID=UPI0028A17DA1|nr:ABC transporter ATP-binding protein [Neobacillus sp.]